MALGHFFYDNPVSCWAFEESSHRFLVVNHSAISAYGYSEEEFLNQLKVDDLRPDEDRQLLTDYLRERPEDLTASGIWRHKDKQGRIFYVRIYSYPARLNGRACRYVMAINADEEVHLQRMLREQCLNMDTRDVSGAIGRKTTG